MEQSLRQGLANLAAGKQLVTVRRPVHWKHAASAVLWHYANTSAVLMDTIINYPGASIAGNLITNRSRFAMAMGWPQEEAYERVAESIDRAVAPVVIESGPVQEVRRTSGIDLIRDFPIPLFSENDAGRYITAGVVIAKDPDTGRRNVCIQRIQVVGPDRLAVFMAARDNLRFLSRYRELGQPMPVAIVIGNHPAIHIASQFHVPGDELEIAGGLLGEPIRLNRALTVDLEIPAESEIVIEGYVAPTELELEGPFGELLGSYTTQQPAPVIHVTAVTSRRSPIFQVIVGGAHPEHLWTGAIPQEAVILRAVRTRVPGAKSVVLTQGGFFRYHAVVCLKDPHPGEAKIAIDAAFAFDGRLKQVVVVADDVDPSDPLAVQQTTVTRMRSDRDLYVSVDPAIHHMDPTMVDGTIAKLGIDATRPYGDHTQDARPALPPAAVMAAVSDMLREGSASPP